MKTQQKRFGRSAAFLTFLTAGLCSVALIAGGCKSDPSASGSGAEGGASLSGSVQVDGSSTVFPISEAVAEEFQKANTGVKVTVGLSGTGGGFKKFGAGEIDVTGASRPIEQPEMDACKAHDIEFIELPVAYDGLSVVVNPKNTWATTLTVEELKKIWAPDSKINNWSQVRAGFPNIPLKLYGPGTDSGTFDYFTKAIVGKEKSSRSDFQASEDDNTLVTGVAGDEGALGYFGYAYYIENKDKLRLVGIDSGTGPVLPDHDTINDGTYAPLSRPIFIYVTSKSLSRPEVKKFVEFYLSEEGKALVQEVGYVPLPDAAIELARKRLSEMKAGSIFSAGVPAGVKIDEFMSKG